MIDDQLRLASRVLDDAAAGDDSALRAALPDDADPQVVEALMAAVSKPTARVEMEIADADSGPVKQRAWFGPDLALIATNSDDPTTEQSVVVARPSVELIHLLVASVGLGLRPQDDDEPIALDTYESAAGFALGEGELPVPPPPEQEQRPVRWWALRWEVREQHGESATGGVVVLDAARLWRQHEARLLPTDALQIWLELGPLLDAIGRASAGGEFTEPPADPEAL